MAIDKLPASTPDPVPHFEPKASSASPHPAPAKDVGKFSDALAKAGQTRAASNPAAGQAGQAGKEKKISHSAAELQTMMEELKSGQQQSQTRSELFKVNQSLARLEAELAQNRAAEDGVVSSGGVSAEASYWDRLGAAEQSRAIEHLKSQIQSLQDQRSALVEELKANVQSGKYRVTGSDIAAGMMAEYM